MAEPTLPLKEGDWDGAASLLWNPDFAIRYFGYSNYTVEHYRNHLKDMFGGSPPPAEFWKNPSSWVQKESKRSKLAAAFGLNKLQLEERLLAWLCPQFDVLVPGAIGWETDYNGRAYQARYTTQRCERPHPDGHSREDWIKVLRSMNIAELRTMEQKLCVHGAPSAKEWLANAREGGFFGYRP